MIPKINSFSIEDNYIIRVLFDDGKELCYDVKEDINSVPSYSELLENKDLFGKAVLDESRTVIVWNDRIDLPSDMIYEYGKG